MRIMLLCLLTACLDSTAVPSVGELYQCEGILRCDGYFYTAAGKGCADSLQDANRIFYERTVEAAKDAQCVEREVEASCHGLGEICVYE